MDASHVIAVLGGPFYVLVGIGMLANRRYYKRLFRDFARDDSFGIYLSAVIALLVGLAIINFHNIWTVDGRVIITVLGWLAVVKGAARLVAPRFTISMIDRIVGTKGLFAAWRCSV